MPHPLETLLTGRTRRGKPIWPATVLEAVGDGTGDYKCIIDETGDVVRASVAKAGDTFAKRTSVVLHRLDDGTTANVAARWVIAYENRPLNVFGTGRSFPTYGDESNDGSDVTRIQPEQLVIQRSQTLPVVVYGVGFDANSTVVVFGSPDLSSSGPLVFTATTITMQVVASVAAVYGTFDLTIGDRVFPRFFVITA